MIKASKPFFKHLYITPPLASSHCKLLLSQPLATISPYLQYHRNSYFSSQKDEIPAKSNLATAQQLEYQALRLLQEYNHEEAFKQLDKALKIRETLKNEENHEIAQIYEALQHLMSPKKHAEQLLKLEKVKLTVLSKFQEENEKAYANCNHNIGYYLNLLGNPSEAQEYLKQAAAIFLKDKSLSYQHAITLENLSADLAEAGDYETCLETSSLACEILSEKEKSETQKFPYVNAGKAFFYKGVSLRTQDRIFEAKESLETSIGYFQKLNSQHETYALALMHLGECLLDFERVDDAENNFSKALELLKAKKNNSKKHKLTVAEVSSALGRIHWSKNNEEQALECFQESYKVYEEINEHEDIRGLVVLLTIARVLRQMGKDPLSTLEKVFPKWLALGVSDEMLIPVYFDYGVALQLAGRTDDALRIFEEGINFVKSSGGSDKLHAAQLWYQAGLIYSERNDHKTAVSYLSSALPNFEALFGSNSEIALSCKSQLKNSQKLL